MGPRGVGDATGRGSAMAPGPSQIPVCCAYAHFPHRIFFSVRHGGLAMGSGRFRHMGLVSTRPGGRPALGAGYSTREAGARPSQFPARLRGVFRGPGACPKGACGAEAPGQGHGRQANLGARQKSLQGKFVVYFTLNRSHHEREPPKRTHHIPPDTPMSYGLEGHMFTISLIISSRLGRADGHCFRISESFLRLTDEGSAQRILSILGTIHLHDAPD